MTTNHRVHQVLILSVVMLLAATNASAQSPNCPAAIPNDNTSDTDAINDCLANQSVVILEDGGVYDIDEGSDNDTSKAIVLLVNGRVLRGEGSQYKPNLRAMDDLWAPIIYADADDWEIHDVAFTGSSGNRTYAYQCGEPHDRHRGSNMILHGSGWTVHDVVTGDALCGTGLGADGTNFAIYNTVSGWNGYPTGAGSEPWADGITIWWCNGGQIYNNWLPENTDIGLIIGGGQDCHIASNQVENTLLRAFGGIMLAVFGGYNGDHNNNHLEYNSVYAWQNKLAFGLLVGPHPWNSGEDIASAGTIENNDVTGAVINLAIEGIGTGTFASNTSTSPQGTQGFGSCTYSRHYIAQHYGSATIQTSPTPDPLYYHDGSCYY